MPVPNFLAQQIGLAQPLVDSAERSNYSEISDTWSEDGGSAAQDITAKDELVSLGLKSAVGYGIYRIAPHVAATARSGLDSETFQRWRLTPDSNLNTVGDALSLNGARQFGRSVRANLLNAGREIVRFGQEEAYEDSGTFWYSALKKVEQGGFGLPIFDNVIKMFTKATYLSDVFSFSTKRPNRPRTINISMSSLGETGRDMTLDFYSRQLGIDRQRLSLIDFLIHENGEVYEGVRTGSGQVVRRNNTVLASKVTLADKGKYAEAALTVLDPRLGMKDPVTGATYAEKIGGGKEGYILFGEELDPEVRRIADRFANKLNPAIASTLRSFFGDEAGRINAANAVVKAESFVTMGLTRTSGLVSEMHNEIGGFFEYLFPNLKKDIFSAGSSSGLISPIQHGHAVSMLGRYSRIATTVGGGLMALNQLGWSMKNGNAVEQKVAGIGQTGLLAMTGAYIGNLMGRRRLAGFLAGGSLGVLGMAGVGPFEGGPVPGVANVIARANEIRSMIGEVTLMNAWKRNVEEMMPGSTDATTALGIGIAAGTGYVTMHRYLNSHRIVEESHRLDYLSRAFGEVYDIPDAPDLSLDHISRYTSAVSARIESANREQATAIRTASQDQVQALRTQHTERLLQIRQEEHARMIEHVTGNAPERPLNLGDLTEEQLSTVERNVNSHAASLRAAGEYAALNNPLGQVADRTNLNRLAETITGFTYEESRQRIIGRNEGLFSRLGAAIENAPRGRAIAYAAAAATAVWWLGTGGLGTREKPRELRELNQGKRLEAVRRNQGWEMGQGAYEGDDILFYRPTLTARLSSGASQAGASGNRGPLEEFMLKNFTYKLERENYWKRPAPITSAAFDQIPFIYPIIQPIADLIKAPKLMHVDEWKTKGPDGKDFYLERSTGLDEIPDQRLGATPMAAPVSPYSPGRVLGRFYEEATSLSGLVGFYAKTAKGILTGNSGLSNQRQELESFSKNMDPDSKFYDEHSGGSFLGIPFTSEVIRRFVHKDTQKQYNPIANQMPSWMPKNFQYGNPYVSIKHGGGSYRAPGEGYAALHSELKGVDPNDYPILHKLNILGDLAPYSSEYKGMLRQAKLMESSGHMTDEEVGFFSRHQEMIREKRQRRSYDSYQFKPGSYDTVSGRIESVDADTLTFTMEGYGGRFGFAGINNDASSLISQFNLSQKQASQRKVDNAKAFYSNVSIGDTVSVDMFASMGQAVDENGVIKGAVTNNGFNVNKSLRSEGGFATEYSQMGSYAMTNYLGKAIGAVWEAGTHFANRMAQPIEHVGMFGAAPINKLLPYRTALEEYEAREVYGTEMKGWDDPIGGWIAPAIKTAMHNYLGLDFQSPGLKRKRDTEEYFDKLKYLKYTALTDAAKSAGEGLLAEQYEGIAERTTFGSTGFISEQDLGRALGGREAMFASGFANEFNPEQQQKIIEALPEHKRNIMRDYYYNADMNAINRAATAGPMSSTGMDYSEQLSRYKDKQGFGESDDVDMAEQMKQQELQRYFQNKSVPKADWIGFNPAVDLEDVKLKYIQSEGMDYHDFGIYPSRASYISRKNYLDQQAVGDLNRHAYVNPFTTLTALNKTQEVYGTYSYNIQGPNDVVSNVNITVDRSVDYNPFTSMR